MRFTKWPAALLCGIALAWPVAAQEEPAPKEPPPAEPETKVEEKTPPPAEKKVVEEPPLHRYGGWTIGLSAWQPSLVGADEEIAATVNNGNQIPVLQGSGSAIQLTVDVTYHLPKDVGAIFGRYDSMGKDDSSKYFQPGQFVFRETRPYPVALGAFDDGTADGVSDKAFRRTHEFRLEFQRRAFDTKWARAKWGAGFRSLNHARSLDITYYAIVPNFPPSAFIDEIIRLQPLPDRFGQTVNFSGNGLGASFDVEFPFNPRFSIVSGLSIAVIHGKSESHYSSQSSYYALASSPDVPLTTEELFALLSQVPSSPTDPPATSDVFQQLVNTRLSTFTDTMMAQSYDVYVGFQVAVWRGLKVIGTARDVYYANVGEYVVPTTGFTSDRKVLNAGYEGYTLGVSWRF